MKKHFQLPMEGSDFKSYAFVTITIFRWETQPRDMFEASSAGRVLFLFPAFIIHFSEFIKIFISLVVSCLRTS